MVAFAGALLTTNLVNNYLAPHYEYQYSGQSYDSGAGTPTWPVAAGNAAGTQANGVFFDGPGQLSVDMTIGEGRALLVGWGFEGYNNSTNASSIRMGIHILRGTDSVQSASTDLSAMTSNSGSGNTGAHHASRWHIYTGLTEGDTLTIDMQAYQSSSTGRIFVDNQWLFVSQFYA